MILANNPQLSAGQLIAQALSVGMSARLTVGAATATFHRITAGQVRGGEFTGVAPAACDVQLNSIEQLVGCRAACRAAVSDTQMRVAFVTHHAQLHAHHRSTLDRRTGVDRLAQQRRDVITVDTDSRGLYHSCV